MARWAPVDSDSAGLAGWVTSAGVIIAVAAPCQTSVRRCVASVARRMAAAAVGSSVVRAIFSPSSTRRASCSSGDVAAGSAGPVVAMTARTDSVVFSPQEPAGPSAFASCSSCLSRVVGTGHPPADVAAPWPAGDLSSLEGARSRANRRSPARSRSRRRVPGWGALACRWGKGTTPEREARRSSSESRSHSATGPRRVPDWGSSCGTTAEAPSGHSIESLSGPPSPEEPPRDSVAGPNSSRGTTRPAGPSSGAPSYWTSDTVGAGLLRAVGRIGAASKASTGSLAGEGGAAEDVGASSAGEAMSTATRPAIGSATRALVSPACCQEGTWRPVAARRPGRTSQENWGLDGSRPSAAAPGASMPARRAIRLGKDEGLSTPGWTLEWRACPTSPRPDEATRLARKATATILPPACCDMPTHVPARGVIWSGRSGLGRTVPPHFSVS